MAFLYIFPNTLVSNLCYSKSPVLKVDVSMNELHGVSSN